MSCYGTWFVAPVRLQRQVRKRQALDEEPGRKSTRFTYILKPAPKEFYEP